MFKKILVPLDGSDLAEGVLIYISELAAKFSSQVDLIGIFVETDRTLDRLYKAYLDKVTVNLQGEGIKDRASLLYGSPAEEILDYAERSGIDLIAMTTYGRSGITRWLMGSVAEKVVKGAKSPVLLVRSKLAEEYAPLEKAMFKRILIPLDGSEFGEAALNHAEALAVEMKASVILLHVNPPPTTLMETALLGSTGKDVLEELRTAGKDYLAGVGKRLKEKGIDTEQEVATGDPAERILEYAKENDVSLIAMSTHGRTGLARWTLGSVADKVIHGAEAPVLLVRAPALYILRESHV